MALNIGAFGAGLIPALQQAQEKARQQQVQKNAFLALQQMAGSGGAAPTGQPQAAIPGATPLPPGGVPQPGGLNSPQGGPVPIGNPTAAPVGAPGQPQPAAPATSGSPSPRGDMMSIIGKIAGLNIPDDQKMAVLDRVGATMSPIEKYTQQLELAQTKLQAQMDMVQERQKTLLQLQNMRDQTSTANTDKRVSATERGQDIGASTAGKRIAATERGQDINSADRNAATIERGREADQRDTTQNRGISSKAIQHEENLKIKQQNADTASDRAGTYKYGTMKSASDRERLTDAKIKAMATKVAPEDKKAFTAAKNIYDRAASLYQSLTRPGATPAASTDDIAFAKQKMDAAQAKMEALAASGSAPTPTKQVDPTLITPENLQHTADKYGITVEEVKKRLGVQ